MIADEVSKKTDFEKCCKRNTKHIDTQQCM